MPDRVHYFHCAALDRLIGVERPFAFAATRLVPYQRGDPELREQAAQVVIGRASGDVRLAIAVNDHDHGSRGAARWNIDKAGEPVSVREELKPLRGHCRGGGLASRPSVSPKTGNKN